MNILSFDIEEWYTRREKYGSDKDRYAKLDMYLSDILDALDDRKTKGTFFCLGGVAKDFSSVVKKIDERGHEVGCHSNSHQWLNKMSENEIREDTRIGIDRLQQCIGKKIKSYRAPAFSVGDRNKIVFDILSENGIERDASVFPIARDFGGFPNFGHNKPTRIQTNFGIIKEFPVCTVKLLGKEFAYSGGGYFRFFPLWYIKKQMERDEYAMTYFHIGDLIAETEGVLSKEAYEAYFKEKGSLFTRYKRYVKSSVGKKSAYIKLFNLLNTVDFVNLEQADNIIEWDQTPFVTL